MAHNIGMSTDIKGWKKASGLFVECHLAGEVGKKNGSLPKLKNYTGNDLPGLYVSGHFTFRIASESLIEMERQGKREKLLQTRA